MARDAAQRGSLPGLWQILRRFWPYARRQRAILAGSLVALFAKTFLQLLEPWPIKVVFDRIIVSKHHAHGWGIAHLNSLDAGSMLALCAGSLIAITALRAVADYLNSVGFALAGNRVLTEVRNDLYRHLQCLSLSYHNDAKGGDLTLRVMADIGVLTDVVITAAMPLFGSFLVVFGMAGFMLWLNWKLGLVALAAFPLFWFSASRLTRLITEVSRRQRQREGAMAAVAAETIGAIKVVQALSLEQAFADSFITENELSFTDGMRASRLSARLGRTLDLQIAVATAFVLWFGARLTLAGELTPGSLVIFFTYLRNAFKPLQDFAKYSKRLVRGVASGERVLDVMDQTPDTRDIPGAMPAPPFAGAVQFGDVAFAYEPNRYALDEVNFEVRPGQHVAVVGKSGSGKSTLASLILRLYDPSRGVIRIDGRDIREYTLESLRGQISVVLQDSLLFASSIRDNIAYGAANADEREVEAAARLANAHQFICTLPQGYDTIVGERGVKLSSGQRQRIAIARAAIRKAPILIMDEPTTGLDNENARAVVEALQRLARERTTFFITHDLHFTANSDLVLYLDSGRVIERGTHAELLQANGRYASLYRLRAAERDDSEDEQPPRAAAS
jgi:ATP-binding cassette, subfamily B, bacterial